MNGAKEVIYQLKGISFPKHEVDPQYDNYTAALKEQEVHWELRYNFAVQPVNEYWEQLAIDTTLFMYLKDGLKKVAELSTETIYLVTANLEFMQKWEALNLLINEAFSHAQGGWVAKNRNMLASIIPQVYDKVAENPAVLQQSIYENWE